MLASEKAMALSWSPKRPSATAFAANNSGACGNRSRALSAHNRASRNSPNSIKDRTCPAQAGTLVGLCSSTRAKSRRANSKSPRQNARSASDDQCVSPAAGRRDCCPEESGPVSNSSFPKRLMAVFDRGKTIGHRPDLGNRNVAPPTCGGRPLRRVPRHCGGLRRP